MTPRADLVKLVKSRLTNTRYYIRYTLCRGLYSGPGGRRLKLKARSMWCAMSRSAAIAVSERINRVGCPGGADVRLQPVAADDIDRAVEQTGNVVF
jgi:hypothetical protein